jgi:DNA-binding response OmpR family regulator
MDLAAFPDQVVVQLRVVTGVPSLGCVDFEPKPIDFERLLGKIRSHLRNHEASNSRTN